MASEVVADHEAIPDFVSGNNVWILAVAALAVVAVVFVAWKYSDRRFAQVIAMPAPSAVKKEEEEEEREEALF